MKAIGTQGGSMGDLQQLAFFAGRYSRQARILLDPNFAKQQRELLVSQKAKLEALIASLRVQLEAVSFKSEEYRVVTQAAEALKTGVEAKFNEYTTDLNKASTKLHRLAPQIKADALATLEAQRKFLLKGGAQKQSELEARLRPTPTGTCRVFRQIWVLPKNVLRTRVFGPTHLPSCNANEGGET